MAENPAGVTLEFEAVYAPEAEIIVPLEKVPAKPDIPIVPTNGEAAELAVILNIETLGLDPLQHRIISIGWKDAADTAGDPTIIMLQDEKSMIASFLKVFEEYGFRKIIGYGIGFDYRFIILRAMYHGLTFAEFQQAELFDLMELMAKGRSEYIYMPQKAPSLSDLGAFFWDYPKPFTDLEMMKYWTEGQLDKVVEFTMSQMLRTTALYYYWLYFSRESISAATGQVSSPGQSNSITTPQSTLSRLTIPEANAPPANIYKCSVCLAESELAAGAIINNCPVCGSTDIRKMS